MGAISWVPDFSIVGSSRLSSSRSAERARARDEIKKERAKERKPRRERWEKEKTLKERFPRVLRGLQWLLFFNDCGARNGQQSASLAFCFVSFDSFFSSFVFVSMLLMSRSSFFLFLSFTGGFPMLSLLVRRFLGRRRRLWPVVIGNVSRCVVLLFVFFWSLVTFFLRFFVLFLIISVFFSVGGPACIFLFHFVSDTVVF